MSSTDFSPLRLLVLSMIATIMGLPMISCMDTTEVVNDTQYSRLSFHNIGCKGTYSRTYLRILSQICFDHSHGYHDPTYIECRKNCFMTAAFRSVAAMHYFAVRGKLMADAWSMYMTDLATLSGTDPRTIHG